MRLTPEQRDRLHKVRHSPSQSFAALTELAELDPATDYVEADLRGIDFGTDDLAGFNFTRAHFEGANLSRARGLHRAKFDGATWDAATRGMLLRDFPGGPQMVLIPAGSFVMGIPPEESQREGAARYDNNARPQHRVTIPQPFYLGRYPVTRAQFAAFVKADKYDAAGDNWRKPGFRQSGEHPVVNVSHQDAEAYVAWLCRKTGKVYRLPSEAEWEYAARAGTATARYWGDDRASAFRFANVADETLRKRHKYDPDPDQYFECDDGYAYTSPVGVFQPNGFGLYDVLGNVFEWVADHWHPTYEAALADGTARTTGDSTGPRVLRGGSWDSGPRSVRAGYRSGLDPGFRVNGIGFRLARTL